MSDFTKHKKYKKHMRVTLPELQVPHNIALKSAMENVSLHLICGMAGSGKTTLARELESAIPAVRLSPDEWIAPLLLSADDRTEMARIREPIERLQWLLAQRLLSLGTSVILENGFWSKDERLDYLHRARSLGVEVLLHYLDVSRDELLQRIERRNANLPPDTFHIFTGEIDEWLAWFDPPDDKELSLFDGFKVYVE
jgi:predicted kinase